MDKVTIDARLWDCIVQDSHNLLLAVTQLDNLSEATALLMEYVKEELPNIPEPRQTLMAERLHMVESIQQQGDETAKRILIKKQGVDRGDKN